MRDDQCTCSYCVCGPLVDPLRAEIARLTEERDAARAALDERDGQWQRGLADLHLGLDGDGCESGDPIDWTRAALKRHRNRLDDMANAKIVSLSDERNEAMAALREFGKHPSSCRYQEAQGWHSKGYRGAPPDDDECDCGLAEALK